LAIAFLGALKRLMAPGRFAYKAIIFMINMKKTVYLERIIRSKAYAACATLAALGCMI
jgi:hypothetical protein